MSITDRAPLDDTIGLRMTRSVPAWQVLTSLVFVVAQAVLLWSGQSRQAEKIADLTALVKEQNALIATRSAQTDHLVELLNDANRRADKLDFRIDDHDRRINALERPAIETRNPRRIP